MYQIFYDESGNPIIFREADNTTISQDPTHRDFRKFLAWNAAQEMPLDWKTPKEAEKSETVPSQTDEIAALKVMVKRLAGDTKTSTEEVDLMIKTGLITEEAGDTMKADIP